MKKLELEILEETVGGAKYCNDTDLASALTGAALGGAIFFGAAGVIGAVVGTYAYIKIVC